MREVLEKMMSEGKGMEMKSEGGGDKIKTIAADIKAVAKEMGMGVGEAMHKVKMACEMDDDADVMEDGMSEEEEAEEPREMDGKKAIAIAMLKKKVGKAY